jgi:hypothetical protein
MTEDALTPPFHVVIVFDQAVEEFRTVGIYTKAQDAEEHLQRIRNSPLYQSRFVQAHVFPGIPYERVVRDLTLEQLGQLRQVLEKLLPAVGKSRSESDGT